MASLPESESVLDIEELAQALFLVLGHHDSGGRIGRRSEVGMDEVRDLERQLFLALSQTRTLNNSSANVNRLPPEVLARIFSFLQPPMPEPPFPLPKKFNSWLAVLRVCRYWRIIAFAFPRLWNHIYIGEGFDGAAITSIKHSAKVLLKVYYDMHSDWLPPNATTKDKPLPLLSEQVDRLRELHISWKGSKGSSIWDILFSPMPNLEILSILGNGPDVDSDHSLSTLFSNSSPRLKAVTFSRIPSRSLENFTGLTHLSLYDQATHHRPSLEQFLEILRSSPGLEQLVLIKAGPDGGRAALPLEGALTAVPLPYLRDLEIGGWTTPDNISFFLSHIVISRSATRCFWGDSLEDLSAFLNIDSEGPFPDILRLVIIGDKPGRQMVGIKDTTLYIHGPVHFPQFHSLFSDAILPNVHEFILCPTLHSMPSSAQLRHMLLGLPSLGTLILAGAARGRIHRLASALRIFNDPQSDNDSTGTVNLHLHTVKIINYDRVDAKQDPYLDILPVVLLCQARAEVGYPLQKFEIENCRRGQLDEFQAHLGETEIPYDPPIGRWIFEILLNEMWHCIRDSTPVLH